MTALNEQIGGDHYRHRTIQRIEFTMANRWDDCASSALKYLLRFRDKGKPVLDLEKAHHFVRLRNETIELARGDNGEFFNWRTQITMERFISANDIIDRDQAAAMLALRDYVHMDAINNDYYGVCLRKIEVLFTVTRSAISQENLHG